VAPKEFVNLDEGKTKKKAQMAAGIDSLNDINSSTHTQLL
jgi:hypothetical protein